MENFNEYNDFVKGLKVYPEKNAIIYPTLGLTGEAGEVAEDVKKWLRGDRELNKEDLILELGDVLFYIAALADDLGYTLEDVAQANVNKLESRRRRDLIKGDGSKR